MSEEPTEFDKAEFDSIARELRQDTYASIGMSITAWSTTRNKRCAITWSIAGRLSLHRQYRGGDRLAAGARHPARRRGDDRLAILPPRILVVRQRVGQLHHRRSHDVLRYIRVFDQLGHFVTKPRQHAFNKWTGAKRRPISLTSNRS
jgi:hypothetical protein